MAKELSKEERRLVERNNGRTDNLFPPCFYCKHIQTIGTQDLHGWTCPAFPEGIPYTILSRYYSHDKPLEYQGNDVVFESNEYDDALGKWKITFAGDWIEVK